MESFVKKKVKETSWSLAKTAALSAGITAGLSLALPTVGIARNGLVAASVASYYQQKYLNGVITKREAFSLFQRAGVKGVIMATKVGIVVAKSTATGVYYICKTIWNKSSKEKSTVIENEESKKMEFDISDDELENENTEVTKNWKVIDDTEWETIHCSEVMTVEKRS